MCGKIDPYAVHTGKYIGELNNFFDSMNGTQLPENCPQDTIKTAVTSQTKHVELWTKMYDDIKNWNFIGSFNLTFPKQFMMTIKSALSLWEAFQKEGRTYSPIGHLNQDSLENFFSTVRWNGGHRHNPSAKEFIPAFLTSLINMLTTTVKGKNCQDDECINLVHLHTLLESSRQNQPQEEEPQEEEEENQGEVQEEPAVTVPTIADGYDSGNDLNPDDPDILYNIDTSDDELPAVNIGVIPGPSSAQQQVFHRNVPPAQKSDRLKVQIQIRHEEMTQQMSALGQSVVAMDILRPFLRKLKCRLCHNLLLEDCSFPQDLVLLMANSTVTQSFPSAAIKNIVNEVYYLAGSKLSSNLHINFIRKTFIGQVKNLPSVKNFNLCVDHNDKQRNQLIDKVSRKALSDLLTRINVDIRKQLKHKHSVKAQKKCAKLQRVTHQ